MRFSSILWRSPERTWRRIRWRIQAPVPRLETWLADRLADWLDGERDRLPLWLPVFMGAGVALYYALRFEPAGWIGPVLSILAVAAAIRFRSLRLLLAPAAACALGFASGQIATARAPPTDADLPSRGVWLSGPIVAVDVFPDGRRIVIQPACLDGAAEPLARSVRIRLRDSDPASLETGDTVRVRALVRPPAPPSYPGAWDLQRDAFYAGLGASGYALEPVRRVDPAVSGGVTRRVQWLREAIAARITAAVPGPAGAVDVTLLTGYALGIPDADRAAFRDSGLAHLLAVAGLHIGIVMGWVLLVTRQGLACSEYASLFWPTRRIAACVALVAGGAYMVLTGMHVPIRRSFLMATLVTLAILADRNPVSVRGLALAAVVLMLVTPYEVPGVSFQMSFSAVLALIAGYEALRPWLCRLHGSRARRFAGHLVALGLTSALAGTASAPYGAYHFGHGQLYFILANMVAVPLAAFWVMPAGLIALTLMPVHLEAVALVPMGWGTELILWVARATAALPAATFAVPHMPLWGLCVFSVGLAWTGLWRTRMRLLGVPIMAAGLVSPLFTRLPDLLVSADARLIGVRVGSTLYLQQVQSGSRFTRDAWAQYWSATAVVPMPTRGDAADGAIRCDDGACLLRPDARRRGALLARGDPHPPFCRDAAVVVSAEPARGLCPKPWPMLVDRFTVWRDGSAAIWLGPTGARVLTDRAERGDRPWVPPPPKPRPAGAPTLPPAARDDGLRAEAPRPGVTP
ncbi:ComEC/Rec2 family competence protein [Rhodopila sp.]|jgi:competence protein ComEC|uniref:ComEC/Rec2 family competence protein n=1 Tax=Rhodopila sp. TaxID=2480087 RepID=UPI002BC69980|nr:ComEC/Rec2 family competence protein [Rhodopila sp.]HVZ09996.1 ComEC/Rec2 family competence protein [Rhodopila sp.]